MFGIGFFELIVIAVVALIFIGPKRLPDFMKQAGRFFVQMRRTANDVRSTFDGVVRDAENEIRREEAEAMKGLLTAKPVAPAKPVETGAHQTIPETANQYPDHPHDHAAGTVADGAKPYQPGGGHAPDSPIKAPGET